MTSVDLGRWLRLSCALPHQPRAGSAAPTTRRVGDDQNDRPALGDRVPTETARFSTSCARDCGAPSSRRRAMNHATRLEDRCRTRSCGSNGSPEPKPAPCWMTRGCGIVTPRPTISPGVGDRQLPSEQRRSADMWPEAKWLTMSDMSIVIVGVVSVLSGVAMVAWLARPSEFRSVRVVSHERRPHHVPVAPRAAPTAARETFTPASFAAPRAAPTAAHETFTLAGSASPRTIVRGAGEQASHWARPPSFASSSPVTTEPAHEKTRRANDIDQPRFFVRYSPVGQEMGPFTASEKARLVASVDSATALLWRQADGGDEPR